MKKCVVIGIVFSIAAVYSFTGIPSRKRNLTALKDNRPNIIVILADDMGFSDAGCYGGEINTPNIDYLAANGLRFTQFFNTSRCCPTRASLLTGLYNHNAGIGEMTGDRHEPGYRGRITSNTVTIAEVLKAAGYHTGMTGKWHVSNTIEQKTAQEQMDWLNHKTFYPAFSPLEQYPTARGFEKYYGNIWGVVDFFDPFSLVNGTTPVKEVPANYYHTDAINDSAVAYIKEFSKDKQPFFLYVAETAPHWPLMAPPEDIARYKNMYTAGWEAIRRARYQKMTASGLIDAGRAPLSPAWPADMEWETNPHKEWDAMAMAVHAAMVDRMDQGIGRIIEALRQTGRLDNSIILFLSDNGASPENAAAYGPGFDRPGETRDGRKIIYPVNKEVMPGAQTSFASIGERWANVANTPYRYWKSESYEGGIHTPLVAFWPKGITTPKGTTTNQAGHVMDLMATFIDIAHAKYPAAYNGNKIIPMQGLSLLPVFKGLQRKGHEVLFNEHFGARYVRTASWKMVARNREAWHLYKISEDETELKDLAAQYPGMVHELDSLWNNWAKDNHVLHTKNHQ